ncbi:MAG: arylsulfatase [Planctomycetota bacterium]
MRTPQTRPTYGVHAPRHLLSLLLAITCASVACAADKPNVILILTDDQGYSDVGYNGNPLLKTPVLDELASRSTVFDRFYASPVCSPTRAGLLTGRYAYRTGVTNTQAGISILRPSETTIAEALKAHGYRTGIFGKWHLGDNAPARPLDQGFDRSLTHVGGMIGMPYNPQDGNSYFNAILLDNGVDRRFKGYCVDVFADAAIDFVQAPGDKPFFVMFAPNTPHHPLTVADRYADPYRAAGLSEETARYYGMITNLDANVGRIMAAVEEAGQAENTIVLFVGDNGTSSLHQQEDLWEAGLRSRKSYVYENGIRVPMFLHVPTGVDGVSRVEAPGMVEDIMPTLLELCGVQTPDGLDGRSLVPLMTDADAQPIDRAMFFQFHRGVAPERYRHFAVMNDPYKLVQPVGRKDAFEPSEARYELYHLADDPFEKHDLAEQHPKIVQRMISEYDVWFDSVTADGFELVRTWIGHERNTPVTLTRQDWEGAGLFDGDLGAYQLDVRASGTYRITCRWGHLLDRTHPVTLRLNDRVLEREILYAESECRFDAVELEEGPLRLEAWVEIDGANAGFRYIEVERID